METKPPSNASNIQSADARSGERLKMDISMAYSFETFPQPQAKATPPRWGTLLDISQRGVCFKANDHFFVQRVISLFLKLSHQTSGIRMLGKIVWLATDWDGATRVGVQFIGALPSDWHKLVAEGQREK